jgi:hypothetical protein
MAEERVQFPPFLWRIGVTVAPGVWNVVAGVQLPYSPLWHHSIMVIIPDCLSGDRGSIPRDVASPYNSAWSECRTFNPCGRGFKSHWGHQRVWRGRQI